MATRSWTAAKSRPWNSSAAVTPSSCK
jgi:hypothetical protein